MYFVWETKVPHKGKIKLNDYFIFESVCQVGGGILTAVHKNLNPVSVGDEYEEEVLVVQTKIQDKKEDRVGG